jgi:hypothetical protein
MINIPSGDTNTRICHFVICTYVRDVGANLAVKKYNILKEIEISASFSKYAKTNKMKSAGSFEILVTTYRIIEVKTQNINIWRI